MKKDEKADESSKRYEGDGERKGMKQNGNETEQSLEMGLGGPGRYKNAVDESADSLAADSLAASSLAAEQEEASRTHPLLQEPVRRRPGRPKKQEPDWTIPPDRWQGSQDEWIAELRDIDPHMCSYPTGRPLSRQSGRPCRGRRAGPNGRCAWHGGRAAAGANHGNFKHGRYSKFVPSALAKKYRDAEANPEVLSLRSDVALIEAMIAERLENMQQQGGTAEDWASASRSFRQVVAAIQGGDPQQLDESLKHLGKVLDEGGALHKQRAELQRMIDSKGRATDRENRRLKDLQQYMTMQQAMALMGFLADSITRHCHDQHVRQLIHADFAKILDGRGGAPSAPIQTIDAPSTPQGGHSP